MALEIKQYLRTAQRLTLTTDLKNSLTILALSRPEIENFVSLELEKNPCLAKKSLYKKETSYGYSESAQGFREIVDDKKSFSLHEHLADQLSLLRLSDYENQCLAIVLQYLDDSGYLLSPIEQIAEQNKLHVDDIKFAVDVIRKCDPAGVGAVNLQECLLLQLSRLSGVPTKLLVIIKDHWDDFEKQNFQKLAKNVQDNIDNIKIYYRYIKDNCDPRPARQFGQIDNYTIVPDVFLFKREGEWVCSLNQDGLPGLKLSKKYEQLLTQLKEMTKDKDAVKYLNDNMRAARSLIKALEERNKTILRVTDAILKSQKEFFELGADYLLPMTLKDVSYELGLHESTISRATAGKFLHSPRGVFELKYFFNARIESRDGKDLANESIKQWVHDIIKNEDKAKPYSDQDISELIEKEKTVKIARRTVAKYRDELGLLPSSKRTRKF